MSTRIRMLLTWLALGGLVVPALAGPHDPPPGPIAPTAKPLAEIEPRTPIGPATTPGDADSLYRITQPGSYYLTGNIAGVAGKHGIEIASGGVTLDLNGFELAGAPDLASLSAVFVSVVNLSGVAVTNGSVRAWGVRGIDLGSTGATRVERISAIGNGSTGIDAGGSGCVVLHCTARDNGAYGITIGLSSTAFACTSNGNTLGGFTTSFASSVVQCTAYSNDSAGISAANGSRVVDCVVRVNGATGISASDNCTVSGCAVSGNTGTGIIAGGGSSVSRCTVINSAASGVIAGAGSSVLECTVTGCNADGIEVGSDCTVVGNSCDGNGAGAGDGAGILVVGSDCRVEGNRCSDADRGIDVNASGNVIIRNTCAGNTINWTIVANNVVGPILDRTSPASAAISGNSAPDSTGSTHPNANFTY